MASVNSTDLLTVPEAAELLRLKPSTIRAWICQRKIPFVKLGRLVRIRRSDVEALIADGTVPATFSTRLRRTGRRRAIRPTCVGELASEAQGREARS
jgi:excisionase family DNA binding protein